MQEYYQETIFCYVLANKEYFHLLRTSVETLVPMCGKAFL